MQTKYYHCGFSLKSADEEGSFAGYASVFDMVDSQKDVILKGAFQRTLQAGKRVKLLWQHRMDEPIGFFTAIREDEYGLYVEGKLLLDVQRGREAYTLLKSGAVEGLSIGYSALGYDYDEKGDVRFLNDVELWEISLVTFPANAAAGVTRVKRKAFIDTEESVAIKGLMAAVERAEFYLRCASI